MTEVTGALCAEALGAQASATPGTSTRPSPWYALISGSGCGLEPGTRCSG